MLDKMMKKLKLEDLQITSFETLPRGGQGHGTVNGNQFVPTPPSFLEPCYPTDANFDCTYGCSQDTACDDTCVETATIHCP
jgi:hypothetical protein